MVTICERNGSEHNLVFSNDPVTKLCETKCVYFCRRANNVKYPAPVRLDGKGLSWVDHAEHLGHTHTVSMDMDCHKTRAKFIGKSVELEKTFTLLSHIRSSSSAYYGT